MNLPCFRRLDRHRRGCGLSRAADPLRHPERGGRRARHRGARRDGAALRQLGQQIIIDNRAGASGIIGTEVIARATPDGYTIGHGNIQTLAIARSVHSSCLTTSQELPAGRAHVRHAEPAGRHAVAAGEVGAGADRVREEESRQAPLRLHRQRLERPRRHGALQADDRHADDAHAVQGASVAITDLTAGRVHLMADNINSIGPHVKSGRLRGLAVTSAKRVPAFAELPTMAEAGVPGFDVSGVGGRHRAGRRAETDRPAAQRGGEQGARRAGVADKLPELGLIVAGSTPEQFAAHIRKEAVRWAEVVKRANVKAD